jgi:hypothetical protein
MTTKTATTDVGAEYQHLALLASQGDGAASKKLMALEDRQDAMARAQRRQAAAALETDRLAVEVAEKTAADARAVNEQQHAKFVAQREAVFVEIETLAEALAREVALCLAVDQEVWGAALACGFPVEHRTASLIVNRLHALLGPLGAGLKDFPVPHSVLRQPLTTTKES